MGHFINGWFISDIEYCNATLEEYKAIRLNGNPAKCSNTHTMKHPFILQKMVLTVFRLLFQILKEIKIIVTLTFYF